MNDFRSRFLSGGLLGQFFHFGPYASLGRGEQALWRERLDQREYAAMARNWHPGGVDPGAWLDQAVALGADYAVLTTRHHDSFCLWPTEEHTYHSVATFGRDLVDEFVKACRKRDIKVGLYYSLADWTCPAYFQGPDPDPAAFTGYIDGIHRQVRDLLTRYGEIDIIWFDGCTPHDSPLWRSAELVRMIRGLQPEILINCRLGVDVRRGAPEHIDGGVGPGDSDRYGDFLIGEGRVLDKFNKPWETCATSTRKLWGYAAGEAWRSPGEIAEEYMQVMATGGNYMLNVGPDGDGRIPAGYRQLTAQLGPWIRDVREELANSQPFSDLTFITRGWLYRKENRLLAVLRNWDGRGELRLCDLDAAPVSARLLGGPELEVQEGEGCFRLCGLPVQRPETLFPVVRMEFVEPPGSSAKTAKRNWKPDLKAWSPFAAWAEDGRPQKGGIPK